jgi:hypothetical protein
MKYFLGNYDVANVNVVWLEKTKNNAKIKFAKIDFVEYSTDYVYNHHAVILNSNQQNVACTHN